MVILLSCLHRYELKKTSGGYCKEYINKRAKGLPLEDTWTLRLDGLAGHVGTIPSAKIKWERRKKGGFAPSSRSGATCALWSNKSTGVLFGGVHDEEEDDNLKSVFYGESHLFLEYLSLTIGCR